MRGFASQALRWFAPLVAACAASEQSAPVAAPSPAPVATAEPEAQPTAAKTSEPKPAQSVLWSESPPPGVEPLSRAEEQELDQKCRRFRDAVADKAAKLPGRGKDRKSATDALLTVLESPPPVKGVDTARCVTLMRRQLVDYKARSLESEAVAQLKRMLVMLEVALGQHGKLCPSVGPTPASLEPLRSGPYTPRPEELEAWKCFHGLWNGTGPLRAQYALESKPAAFRIVARVPSGPAGQSTELYIEGKVQGDKLDKEAPVMRAIEP